MRPTSFMATAAAVLVGGALLVTVPGATSAAPTTSSAYGVAVTAGGQQVVPPSPSVESTDGSTQTSGGSIPPEAGPLLAGGVMTLSAGDDRASARVADLTIGDAADLPPELADQLAQIQGELDAACEALEEPASEAPEPPGDLPLGGPGLPDGEDLVELCEDLAGGQITELATVDVVQAQCAGDSGSVDVLGARALGVGDPLDLRDVAPNTELFPENPLLNVTLNRQSKGPRGSFTVDGMVVSLAGGEAEAVVASATCGEQIRVAGKQNPEPRRAPAPEPQRESAPVTG